MGNFSKSQTNGQNQKNKTSKNVPVKTSTNQTGRIFDHYYVTANLSPQQLNQYRVRTSNKCPYVLQTHFFEPVTKMFNCYRVEAYELITEHASHWIGEYSNIGFVNCCIWLYSALRGFQHLYRDNNSLNIEENLIFHNDKNQVKVWMQEDPTCNVPKSTSSYSEKELTRKLISIVDKHSNQELKWKQFIARFQEIKLNNFFDAIDFIEFYLYNHNLSVLNQLINPDKELRGSKQTKKNEDKDDEQLSKQKLRYFLEKRKPTENSRVQSIYSDHPPSSLVNLTFKHKDLPQYQVSEDKKTSISSFVKQSEFKKSEVRQSDIKQQSEVKVSKLSELQEVPSPKASYDYNKQTLEAFDRRKLGSTGSSQGEPPKNKSSPLRLQSAIRKLKQDSPVKGYESPQSKIKKSEVSPQISNKKLDRFALKLASIHDDIQVQELPNPEPLREKEDYTSKVKIQRVDSFDIKQVVEETTIQENHARVESKTMKELEEQYRKNKELHLRIYPERAEQGYQPQKKQKVQSQREGEYYLPKDTSQVKKDPQSLLIKEYKRMVDTQNKTVSYRDLRHILEYQK